MTDRSEQVMRMVKREIDKQSDIPTQTLYDKAKKLDKSIGQLTLRQFHARYPLQVKRRMGANAGKKPRAGRTRKPQVNREAVRSILVGFAGDVAEAESKAEVIRILARLDSYVNKIEAAVTA